MCMKQRVDRNADLGESSGRRRVGISRGEPAEAMRVDRTGAPEACVSHASDKHGGKLEFPR